MWSKGDLVKAGCWRHLRVLTKPWGFCTKSFECCQLWLLLAYARELTELGTSCSFSWQRQYSDRCWYFIFSIVIAKLSSLYTAGSWFRISFDRFYFFTFNWLEHLLVGCEMKTFAVDHLGNNLLGLRPRTAAIWRLFFHFLELVIVQFLSSNDMLEEVRWGFRCSWCLLTVFWWFFTKIRDRLARSFFFLFLYLSSKIWVINLE